MLLFIIYLGNGSFTFDQAVHNMHVLSFTAAFSFSSQHKTHLLQTVLDTASQSRNFSYIEDDAEETQVILAPRASAKPRIKVRRCIYEGIPREESAHTQHEEDGVDQMLAAADGIGLLRHHRQVVARPNANLRVTDGAVAAHIGPFRAISNPLLVACHSFG